MRKHPAVRRAVFGLAGLTFCSTAPAQYTWKSAVSGSWSEAARWRGNAAPVSAVNSYFTFEQPSTGSFTTTQDLGNGFQVGALNFYIAGGGTVTLAGGTINLSVAPGLVTHLYAFPSDLSSVASRLNVNSALRNDGVFFAYDQIGAIYFNAPITGAGSLVTQGGPIHFAANASQAGGFLFQDGRTYVDGTAQLAIGAVRVGGSYPNGSGGADLFLTSASSIGGNDARLRVASDGLVRFSTFDSAALARVTNDSNGVIGLDGTSTVAASLALPAGTQVSIGTVLPDFAASATFNPSTSFTPAKNTYRFGGADGANPYLDGSSRLNVLTRLTDNGAQTRSLVVGPGEGLAGGRVAIRNLSNTFTGGTTVKSAASDYLSALMFDFTPAAGQTPLGSGSINVYGTLVFQGPAGALGALPNTITFQSGSELVFSNVTISATGSYSYSYVDRWPDAKPIALNGTHLRMRAGTTEIVGAVTYSGGSRLSVEGVDGDDDSTGNGTLDLASLTRSKGTLSLAAAAGRSYRVRNATAVVNTANGLVSPSIVSEPSSRLFSHLGDYLRLDANNLLVPFNYATSFNPVASVQNEVVTTSNLVTVAGTEYLAAWRLETGAVATLPVGTKVVLTSGGLMLNDSAAINGDGVLEADNNLNTEAFVYVNRYADGDVNTAFRARSGLSKFGFGTLRLNGINTLYGAVRVNEGALVIGPKFSVDTPGYSIDLQANTAIELNGDQYLTTVKGARQSTFTVAAHSDALTSSIDVTSINVADGGTLYLYSSTGASGVSKVSRLSLASGTLSSHIDLTNNTLLVDYRGDTVAPAIRGYLSSGYSGGQWNGSGMNSSRAGAGSISIGYAEATDLFTAFPATFANAEVDPSTLIVRTTLAGDANLDRLVNSTDFGLFASHYGSALGTWAGGDFNYDGTVDTRDFAALVAAFGKTFPTNGALPGESFGTVVPEPASLALLVFTMTFVRRSRRSVRTNTGGLASARP